MLTAHVNIGSNLGHSRELVEKAAEMIGSRLGVEIRRAPLELSQPWGYESPHPYVNLGIAFETNLEPEELLSQLLEIQQSINPSPHRDEAGAYLDRSIDIDLIAMGQTVMDTPLLTLPHPKMHLRLFVARPMAFLEPEWRHPLLGLSLDQIISHLNEKI